MKITLIVHTEEKGEKPRPLFVTSDPDVIRAALMAGLEQTEQDVSPEGLQAVLMSLEGKGGEA